MQAKAGAQRTERQALTLKRLIPASCPHMYSIAASFARQTKLLGPRARFTAQIEREPGSGHGRGDSDPALVTSRETREHA